MLLLSPDIIQMQLELFWVLIKSTSVQYMIFYNDSFSLTFFLLSIRKDTGYCTLLNIRFILIL